MMHTFRIVTVIGCLVTGLSVSSGAQSNITLTADADTCIREHSAGSQRATSVMEVRSRPNEGSGRQNIAYIRFDLNVLASAPQPGATFLVTRSGGVATTAEVVQVYGLPDTFGNTPQGWLDTGLTYNSSGLEVPGDGDSTTQDLDPGRLELLGNLPTSASAPETLTLSGAALDTFLSTQYASGGLATLMLVQSDSVEREQQYNNSENAGNPPPRLEVVGELRDAPADTTPPTVAGGAPAPGATDVSVATMVTATFSEAMNEASITGSTVFSLKDNLSSPVAATYVYNPATFTMTLTPDALLEPNILYTATVVGGAGGATDEAGNPLAEDFTWTFTSESDAIPPIVVDVSPTNGAAEVDAGAKVAVTFDEGMDPATITSSTFYLLDASDNPVPAAVTYDGGSFTATLSPLALLDLQRAYTAVVVGGPGGVTDQIGNPLDADETWSFTVSAMISTIRLLPDADARLANDPNRGPTSSTGNDSTYECRWHEAPRVRIAYIRYDISDIPPALYPSATLSGTFTDSGRNGPADGSGLWNVYGLNDDVVADGAGRLGNDWPETQVNYSNAGGVDNALALGSYAFTDSTFLGSIALSGDDVQPLPFSSTPEDLDLAAFLNADTDGLVTFLWINASMDGHEYRINSKEGSTADGHGPTTLNFDPSSDIIGVELLDESAIEVTWGVRSNHSYGVERSLEDLAAPTWIAVASNLVGEVVNSYTDAPPVGVHAAYRVVDEGEIPPAEYLFEDFESDPFVKGWLINTGATHQAGTDWEWGTPTSGPGNAQDGTGAMGTNLAGDYGPNADISLLSPVIDLTAVGAAGLTFGNFYDTEGSGFDEGEIYVRDDAGAVISGLESPIATYGGFVTSWQTPTVDLPEAALDRTIRIEFRFFSDSGTEFTGWYLDNVRVTE